MKTRSIHQIVHFPAKPEVVYQILIDPVEHSAFTGAPVDIEPSIPGSFSVFDGYCHGYNIELDPGRKIVQAWHFAEDGWPEDHFSICKFELEEEGNGTRLEFEQTGVPEFKAKAIEEGWHEYYWEAILEYLHGKR
jgi:activator of HSP90 ATPase